MLESDLLGMLIVKKINQFSAVFAALLASGISTQSQAAEPIQWQYAVGVHDMFVPDVSSGTAGVFGGVYLQHLTKQDILLTGELEVLLDHDKDHLDSDHVPVWFKTAFLAKGNLLQPAKPLALNWVVDWVGKRNTVSSVEKQLKIFPGLEAEYKQQQWSAAAKLGAGYYYLEIDDDAPKPRGRSGFGVAGVRQRAAVAGWLDLARKPAERAGQLSPG
jgi:hypothetical protein